MPIKTQDYIFKRLASEILDFEEVITTKKSKGKIITVDYQINSETPISFKGDGLIVSTPLGSTGYSYSAGGQKLDIKEHLFAVTPICPHFLSTEPRLVKDNAIISINSPFSYENKTGVYVDGNYLGELKEMNYGIAVEKNELKRRQIKFNEARDQLGESTIEFLRIRKN